MDVVDFRDFYATPLGAVVRSDVCALIHKMWPNFDVPSLNQKHKDITLTYGYPLPYLSESSHHLAFMPASIGVIGWPKNCPRTALIEEDLFPLPDQSVDRLLVIHGLEISHNPTDLLEECRRVLVPEGRLLIITPNRRGLWARRDATPLGRGLPYTMTQLSRLLRGASLTPTQFMRTLYTPPIDSNFAVSMQSLFEKMGEFMIPKFSGLIAIEAVKTVYCGIPTAKYSRRFQVALRTARVSRCVKDVSD
ncbi:MAG: methyltransferase domain-containing protein [Candidatus Paracaedibacteraceae bacterium]|nr:methyltransferase domain-containing protein [Candidatus Paracaedibacteraceae bacterium]